MTRKWPPNSPMPESGVVVANSGPIIALAVIGQLELLGKLYDRVVVPDAVFREVSGDPGRPGAAELTAATWVDRIVLDVPPDPLLAEELGAGEAEAITLAARRHARLLLMDDRRARRVAEAAYGLRVRGVAALVVAAKRQGFVGAVRPLLEAMRTRGYFLSDRVLTRACREAGEE